MSHKLPIRLRAANQDDVPLIFNSWLKSFRNSLFTKPIDNTVYYQNQHKLIEKLLKESEVMVACNEKDPTQVYGYVCASKVEGFFVMHYIYVKHPYRNMGLGKELLNSFEHDATTASIYTHHTRVADRLAPKFNFIYMPYLLFDLESNHDDEA